MIFYSNDLVYNFIEIHKCKTGCEILRKNIEINRNLNKINELNIFYSNSQSNEDIYNKIKENVKVIFEKILSAFIALYKAITIKIAEFKGYIQNGIYKKFDKSKITKENLEVIIQAVPLRKDFSDAKTFIEKVTVLNDDFINLMNNENYDYNQIYTKFYEIIKLNNHNVGLISNKPKIDDVKTFDYININIRKHFYDLNMYNDLKASKQDLKVSTYLRCGPGEVPKALELLSPSFLTEIIDMRKSIEKQIDGIKKYMNSINYEPVDYENRTTEFERREIIKKGIRFLYELNYRIFMELILVRASIAKAIHIAMCGEGIKKLLYQNPLLNNNGTKNTLDNVKKLKTKTGSWIIGGGIQVESTEDNIFAKGELDIESDLCKKLIEIHKILYHSVYYKNFNSIKNMAFDKKYIFSNDSAEVIYPAIKELKNLLNIEDDCGIEIYRYQLDQINSRQLHLSFSALKETDEVFLTPSDSLYHTSINPNLKYLKPRIRGFSTWLVFESPRIYCGYNSILNKSGEKLNSMISRYKFRLFNERGSSLNIYKIDDERIKYCKLFRDKNVDGSDAVIVSIPSNIDGIKVKNVTDLFLTKKEI